MTGIEGIELAQATQRIAGGERLAGAIERAELDGERAATGAEAGAPARNGLAPVGAALGSASTETTFDRSGGASSLFAALSGEIAVPGEGWGRV